MDHGVDVISLVHREKSMFRRFLEDRVGGKMLSKIFPARQRDGRSPDIYHSSNRGIDVFVALCTVVCALIAFIGPLWILDVVPNKTNRLGVITAFTVAFALLLAWLKATEPGVAILGTAA